MYPTDIREFNASRLVAHIAKALNTGAPLELRPLYDELDLQPTTIASYHAAAAAVHVLLAHEAGQSVGTDSEPRRLVAAPNGAGGGAGPKAGAGAHARRPVQRRAIKSSRKKKSSLTQTSKRQTAREPLKCPECGRLFLTAGRLTNHRRDQHGSESAVPLLSATAESAA